ncbi:MAG: NeuD/PglB/VioB family sugar acetyltransferase [Opitutales bacterium]
MEDVYIVGAGGFAREVFAWASQHPECGARWRLAGFLDDNPKALDGFDLPVAVVGSIRDHQPKPNELLLLGLGLPKAKRACVESLQARGGHFLSLIHPSAVLGQRITLGDGVVICPGVIVTCDVRIGSYAMLNCHATVGHDALVSDYTTLSGHVDLTGHVQVGAEVFFGSRASVIPGKRVGDAAVVGAGAVVIRDVPTGSTVFGNPARVIA